MSIQAIASSAARSGAPSALHEYRAKALSTMATLAGFVTTMDGLPDGTRPDVLQLRPDRADVFLGDAKATETPGNHETYQRLDRYAGFFGRWVEAGGGGVFALAVAEADAYGWREILRDLCLQCSGGIRVEGRAVRLEVGTAVVWHSFVRGRANIRR